MPISETPEWRALAEHHQRIKDTHLRQLFAEDPEPRHRTHRPRR